MYSLFCQIPFPGVTHVHSNKQGCPCIFCPRQSYLFINNTPLIIYCNGCSSLSPLWPWVLLPRALLDNTSLPALSQTTTSTTYHYSCMIKMLPHQHAVCQSMTHIPRTGSWHKCNLTGCFCPYQQFCIRWQSDVQCWQCPHSPSSTEW